MTTPIAQRYVCPRCRTAATAPARFCAECGAKMTDVSPLEAAREQLGRASTYVPSDATTNAAGTANPTATDITTPLPPRPSNLDGANAPARFRISSNEVGGLRRDVTDTRVTAARRALPADDRRLSDSNQAWLGKIIDGRYLVQKAIGRGGVGVVYKVAHLRMGKIAAMKVLHRDLSTDPEMAARFAREANAVSQLNHPHTVSVFDFGNVDGTPYLIMEYVRGVDLGYLVERDGPLPPKRAVALVLQICAALSEAHERGIVHRDLKPENVLITRTSGGRDFVKVLDFGLAKLDERTHPEASFSMTDRAMIVGTPYFMSPEQIRGDDIDTRSDVYACGALLFNILTGTHLFTASTAVGVMTKHLTEPAQTASARAPAAGIDAALDAICARALRKDREERFANIGEMITALEAWQAAQSDAHARRDESSASVAVAAASAWTDGESVDRLQRSDLESFERGLRRRKLILTGGALVTVVGGAAVAGYLLTRPAPLRSFEAEPNNELAQANRIAATTQVTGFLGKRQSLTEGDRDIFELVGPSATRWVTVMVTPPTNQDVAVRLLGVDGTTLVESNDAPTGGQELIFTRRVDGKAYLSIETARTSTLPTENVSDTYALQVATDRTAPTTSETEPNNGAADATPLAAGTVLRGYLERQTDIDVMKWQGSAGPHRVRWTQTSERPAAFANMASGADSPSAAAGIPPSAAGNLRSMRWQINDGPWHTEAALTVELPTGALIRIERTLQPSAGGSINTLQWQVVVD